MLQIISGKFFENDSIHISECKGILYSNFYWILPIETCIGTLEPVDIFNTTSISPYVFSYKNQMEISQDDATIQTGDSEIINQFRLLCIFGLSSFFDVDRNYVETLCRKYPKNSSEKILPSNFVPRFLDSHINGKNEEVENFKKFIDKTIGLPRVKYIAVINSINAFSQALQTLNYNLDLAYSLMIYSLESLTQKFDDFEPIWEDYELSIQKKLDKLFEEKEFEKFTIESIQQILLKSSNLRTTKRFIDFTSKHVTNSFFIEEADGLKNPLRKSQLERSLNNAYKMRSNYVHELKEIEKSLKFTQFIKNGEVLIWENKPYLTFSGLTRLVHHVILNFIDEETYLKKEKYPWRQDLPDIIDVAIHPKHWIWEEEIFNPSDINITFSGWLILVLDTLMHGEKLLDLTKLMLKIENLIETGLKKEYKSPMISFYFFYNELMIDKFKSPKYKKFIKKHDEALLECNIENMITLLILNFKWPWKVDQSVLYYSNYRKNKFNKKSLSIPNLFEVFILINIANQFLEEENIKEFRRWIELAILELPGELKCQQLLEEYKSKKKTIIILDTLNECLKIKKETD